MQFVKTCIEQYKRSIYLYRVVALNNVPLLRRGFPVPAERKRIKNVAGTISNKIRSDAHTKIIKSNNGGGGQVGPVRRRMTPLAACRKHACVGSQALPTHARINGTIRHHLGHRLGYFASCFWLRQIFRFALKYRVIFGG